MVTGEASALDWAEVVVCLVCSARQSLQAFVTAVNAMRLSFSYVLAILLFVAFMSLMNPSCVDDGVGVSEMVVGWSRWWVYAMIDVRDDRCAQ